MKPKKTPPARASAKRQNHPHSARKKTSVKTAVPVRQAKMPALHLSGRSQAWYGWHPDLPDHRDFLYSALRAAAQGLPPQVDLRQACSPVENQLNLGSCTANALIGALEFLQLKRDPGTFSDLSRLFLYYNERVLTHTVQQDSGGYLRDGIKCLHKLGICEESHWPYVATKFTDKPTPACYREALKHQITSYHSLRSQDECRTCLAAGYPVVFGFTVYESFESEEVARSGMLHYPADSETPVGGHAVLAVGYNDMEQRLLVRNSWGADWGMDGYFTMPYEYAFGGHGRAALASDFWTIRDMEQTVRNEQED